MVKRKITPLLLAASVLVSGFTGYFVNNQSAMAITKVDELSDVCSNTWAYNALKNLVEKYNVIEGYPDKTFRGDKAPSRYELAAALNAVVKAMGKDIARLGAEKADKEDLATVAKLEEEFGTELRTLQARSDALEARASKIESKNDEQDNRLAVLEKLKIYGDVSFGGLSDLGHTSLVDGISAIGRTRFNVDYPVVEDKGGSIVGPGEIHTRLIAAFGRTAPLFASTGGLDNNSLSGTSSIAGDASAFNEGIGTSSLDAGTTTTGGNLRANAYIDSAYYTQILKARMPYLPCDGNWRTSFGIDAGVIPWKDLYFQSPYQGDDNNQFQNTALQNNAAILQNFTIPRIALQMNQSMGRYLNAKVTTDVSFLDNSDIMDGLGFTVEGDIGYNLGFLNKYFCKTNFNQVGNVFGGYYFIHPQTLYNSTTLITGVPAGNIPTSAGNENTAQGFYAGATQEIYKGFAIFGSFANNNTGPTSALLSALQNGTGTNVMYDNSLHSIFYGIKQSWNAGFELPIRTLPKFITFNKRQRDAIGAAISYLFPITAIGSPSNGGAVSDIGALPTAGGREKAIEVYYKAQITDGFALIPSVQIIGDSGAWSGNGVQTVVGLRSTFTF